MKESDLAYAAGFFDGEGSIGIYHHRKKTCKSGWQNGLRVRGYNTNEMVIRWFEYNFGGSVHKKKAEANRQQGYVWNADSRIAYQFLKQVLPYLKVKKSQAELALSFQERRQPTHRTQGQLGMVNILDQVDRILISKLSTRNNKLQYPMNEETI